MTEDHLEQTGTDAPVDLLRHIHVEDRSDASSVILHVPHASRLIPDELRASFVVAEPAIVAELDALTDTATDRIAGAAATASIVRSGLSRLVVDVERFPDDTEEMNAVDMGVLYTHGSRRQEIRRPTDRDRSVVAEYLNAYASRFADLVDRVLARHGSATIIDVHSFPTAALPYELHGELRRPELCIGTDPDHTPRSLVRMVRDAFAGLEIAEDEPFIGSYVPLRHYRRDDRVHAVMLEIRRDQYMDERSAAVAGERVEELGHRTLHLVHAVHAAEGQERTRRQDRGR